MGRVLVVLGVGLLLLAGLVLLAAFAPKTGWDILANLYVPVSEFLGVLGACALLPGIFLVRQGRQLREFNEAMAFNNRSLRGIVCDQRGAPIAKATVDVFIEGSQGTQVMTTMQTDADGRFSADLPEGQYVLKAWAPELGESSLQCAVSKLERIPELQVKL